MNEMRKTFSVEGDVKQLPKTLHNGKQLNATRAESFSLSYAIGEERCVR